ncbi:hypothetical protein DFA_08554 [Cavenderia fasciculata]|uniref:RRM domain-containing protein n=1 Tax=Cavenderia fasciculata TaxID=261658 RepID=F4Q2Z4_CACFS|nr:uncharacterized protein DFA_08554 [Cavenderia fasciculata]EGG17558.1 hypothetical protein DFA_08554 [Cavenderia fasciculata]|eukprot:XP_004356042.1 hypothetical protein DFA_08554 [Cavenderia fasciculata]
MNKEVAKKQIFVKNLPFAFSKDELDTYFSDVGPIKRSFLINRPGQNSSTTGEAFLWFALDGHAEKAVTEKNGTMLGGRKIIVQIAKPKIVERPTKATTTATETKKDGEEQTTTTGAVVEVKKEDKKAAAAAAASYVVEVKKETVVEEDPKEKRKRLAEEEKQRKVEAEQKKKVEMDNKRAVEIVIVVKDFVSDKNAICDLVKLPKSLIAKTFTIPFSNGAVRIICRDERACSSLLSAFAKTKYNNKKIICQRETQYLKHCEIILRNLSESVTMQRLEELFSVHGEILLIKMPTKLSATGTQVNKGFAFILYSSKSSAEKALKDVNSTDIQGRPCAIDWALPQSEYLQIVKKKEEELAKKDKMQDSDDESDDESDDDKPKGTVDFDSDEEDENNQKFGDSDDESSFKVGDSKMNVKGLKKMDVDSEDEEDENSEDDDDEEQDDDEDSDNSDDSDSDLDSDEEEKRKKDEEKKELEKKKQKNVKEINEGKTLFIRNLSFDTKEDRLREEFEKFGAIEFIKLVMDHATNRSTGKAFIKFTKKEYASAALDFAAIQTVYDTASDKNLKKKDRRKKDSLDMSALLQSGIVVDGRNLIVDAAVDHEKAGSLKDRRAPKLDKRNKNLLDIGRILPESEQGLEFTDKDWKMRDLADQENNHKFKVNPNYFVSPTRICIRNLPLEVGDKQLSRAIKQLLPESKTKVVLHTKIAVNKERITGSGKPRSLGFGFAEFTDHQSALKVVHGLNGKIDAFGKPDKGHRLFAQFSIEDARTVKKRTEFLQKIKKVNSDNKKKTRKLIKEQRDRDAAEGKEVDKTLSRGQKQREKRRKQRESGDYAAVEQAQLAKEHRELLRKKRELEKENREPVIPQHIIEKKRAKENSIKTNPKGDTTNSSFDDLAQKYVKRNYDDFSKSEQSQSLPSIKRDTKKKRWYE